MEKRSFQEHITSNKVKSFVLIIVILIFFVALGYVIARILDPTYFFLVMALSIGFSLSYVIVGYYNSDKIAVASVRAKPASQVAHRMLFNAVESMALASGLPMPKLFVMDSNEINAFASGRDPKHAVICVTSGALQKLNKQELEGVIAHEMSHIANYDMRLMTLTVVLVGMISIVAELFLRGFWHSGGDKGEGKAQIVLILIGIALAVLAPIITQLVSLSISRRREYTADATAVKMTRYPPGLANALKKIRSEHVETRPERHRVPKVVAPLFMADPYKRDASLFDTHPPIAERIRRLETM